MLGNSQTEFQNNRGTWFNVGSTVHACTKGLWIMKEPVYVTKNQQQMPVFIIDTEGLSAIDEEHNHDSKIFLLSILL